MPDQPPTNPPPSSILIVGAGVFGLSTLRILLLSPHYATTSLHLLDPYLPPLSPTSTNTTHPPTPPQNPHASSIDTSRIIRADYAHPAYSRLAASAQHQWRRRDDDEVYKECGLVVTATRDGHAYVDKARRNAEGLGQAVEGIGGGEGGVRRAVGLPSSSSSSAEGERGDDAADGVKEEGNGVGAVGYINHVSGFAHAGRAMEDAMGEVVRLSRARNATDGMGKVVFHRTRVAALVTSPAPSGVHLHGVTTTSGPPIYADIIILATGAWTPSLLDLRGRAKATAQVVAYLPLTDEEAAVLKEMKVLLNLGTGMFAIPPVQNGEGVWELKVARHGYGYENPVGVGLDAGVVETGLPSRSWEGGKGKVRVEQSLPSSHFTPIPLEAEQACRGFLRQMFPPSSSSLGQLADRPFSSTRLCWYTDTPKGDFLVDFHPKFRSPVGKEGGGYGSPRNLLIATGGSGHAFKFLPVIGEKIVARLEGRLEPELAGLWEWKRDRVDGDWGEVDGSRGGAKGMKLEDEWAKGRRRESKL